MDLFDIGKLIRLNTRNIKKYIDHQLKDYNINEGQLEYFIMISENPGINQKELADIMYVGKASVTKAVKKLLQEEMIYRKLSEADKRNYGLYISEYGATLITLFKSIPRELSQRIQMEMTEDDIETLYNLLSKLSTITPTL